MNWNGILAILDQGNVSHAYVFTYNPLILTIIMANVCLHASLSKSKVQSVYIFITSVGIIHIQDSLQAKRVLGIWRNY